MPKSTSTGVPFTRTKTFSGLQIAMDDAVRMKEREQVAECMKYLEAIGRQFAWLSVRAAATRAPGDQGVEHGSTVAARAVLVLMLSIALRRRGKSRPDCGGRVTICSAPVPPRERSVLEVHHTAACGVVVAKRSDTPGLSPVRGTRLRCAGRMPCPRRH